MRMQVPTQLRGTHLSEQHPQFKVEFDCLQTFIRSIPCVQHESLTVP